MSYLIGTTTVTGVTGGTTTRRLEPWLGFKAQDQFFQSGAFGFSTIAPVAGQTWHVILYTKLADTDIPFAGLSSIGVLSTTGFIPILRADGVSQTNILGIPRPSKFDLVGSSAGVGITFGIAIGFAFNNAT